MARTFTNTEGRQVNDQTLLIKCLLVIIYRCFPEFLISIFSHADSAHTTLNWINKVFIPLIGGRRQVIDFWTLC
jgi:hypothetical protein